MKEADVRVERWAGTRGAKWGSYESNCGCVRSIEYIAPLRESIIPGLYRHPVVSQMDVLLTPCPRHETDADRSVEGRFEARADRWL